jgi:N-acetylated-alpha-linked acidic dipeptidase
VKVDLAPLAAAARREQEAGDGAERRLVAALAGGLDDAKLAQADAILLALEREWLTPQGLPGRPWFRNLYSAPDADSGYAAWMLPALRRAVEARDADGVRAAVDTYLAVFARLEERLDALATLAGGTPAEATEGPPPEESPQ